jgi:MFS family permease
MILIGGMTYPLYSIAGAYTNDWVPAERLTAAASQLVLLYGAGAFFGPIIGSFAMDTLGDDGYPLMTVATHLLIATFLTVRIVQHPPSLRAKPWNAVPVGGRLLYLPATAVAMGRLLRPGRRRRS